MVAIAQQAVGDRYTITANAKMVLAKQNDEKGGRSDDVQRAREIQKTLADDHVAALVTLRGGSWFTRVLDRINFDVLRQRKKPLYLFGFSEMTSLIAIAGRYAKTVGLYDLGPAFLLDGLEAYANKHIRRLTRAIDLPDDEDHREGFASGWASTRFPQEFEAFFRDVANILEGKGSCRKPTGRLLSGSLPTSTRITIAGGNLSVLMPLIKSRFASAIETRGKWLALEDLNETPGTIDRMLAGLKLSGLLDRAEGIILGEFHDNTKDLTQAVYNILKYHVNAKRRIPIIALENFGHVYPIAPLPLHREVMLHCHRDGRRKPKITLEIPWSRWARK